jgi:hypothetical protein
MINKLIDLANVLDESGLKKEADQVDGLIKSAFAPLGPIAIEKLISTSPVWGPVAVETGVSAWVWVATALGIGAAAGGTYYYSQEEAEVDLKRVEALYNKNVYQQRLRELGAGTDIDGDLDDYSDWVDSESTDSTQEQSENLKLWYDDNRGWVNQVLEKERGVVIPFPSSEPSIDEDSELGYSTDLEYDEEDDEDTSPLDCNFLCWAEQIEGSDGLFSYHFMYNYEDMSNEVRRILSIAILAKNYSLIKKTLLPLGIGGDDGILSSVHPSEFRTLFKTSGLENALCRLCPGESYNIVYLSDTHKPKITTDYGHNNIHLGISEDIVHYIYFDPILIKTAWPIMGVCKTLK